MAEPAARFFDETLRGEPAAVELTDENARIAKRVLRLRDGDAVELLNGAGTVLLGQLEGLRSGNPRVRISGTRNDARSMPELTLIQGLPKGEKSDFIVQKAVEWGVARVVFVPTEFSVPGPAGGRVKRWRRIAVEALRQSGNPFLPEVGEVGTLREALARGPAAWSVLFDERERSARLRDVLLSAPPASVRIAVGPEGGWSSGEREEFLGAGFIPVSFGPLVLRAETASVSAMAAVFTLLG